MAQYTKSYSNYVLKKHHQDVKDGEILERDITTIDALNQFAPGQVPIFRDGTFLITVNNEAPISRDVSTTPWEENETSGSVWTIREANSAIPDSVIDIDDEIELNTDCRSLRDFAYFGSCSELIRTSLADIMLRFPGELYSQAKEGDYVPSIVTYQCTTVSSMFDRTCPLGSYLKCKNDYETEVVAWIENLSLLQNPFSVDMITPDVPDSQLGDMAFRFFSNGGYANYHMWQGDGEPTDDNVIKGWNMTVYDENGVPTTYTNGKATGTGEPNFGMGNPTTPSYTPTSTESDGTPKCRCVQGTRYGRCPGQQCATITLNGGGGSLTINAFMGDENKIYYLVDQSGTGYHIRPNQKFLYKFYRENSVFQKVLMNPKTDPMYKATFAVIKEDEHGFYSELEEFVMPIGDGGYNIASDAHTFGGYVSRLSAIANFYDENFTNNIWRSMTHEAIKNFDWTYTREYSTSDNGYVEGGMKIAKFIQLFGREMDEIKAYIDALPSYNRVTYDGRNDAPDYFLSDLAEQLGWEPFPIYYKNSEINPDAPQGMTGYIFTDDTTTEFAPYELTSKKTDYLHGYFIECSSSTDCEPKKTKATESDKDQKFNKNTNQSMYKNRIYGSDKTMTPVGASNEFLRRLCLNAKHMLRHKGTNEGVEMALAMFGLRSERWAELKKRHIVVKSTGSAAYTGGTFDYTIKEYTQFGCRRLDYWHTPSQMYYYDFINKSKLITYDTADSRLGVYYSYQGLPVTYRECENVFLKNGSDANVYTSQEIEKVDPSSDGTITPPGSAIKDLYGNPIHARYIYPYYDKTKPYDGKFWYQMRGGWRIRHDFMFDNDGNVIKREACHDTSKETLRSVKTVNNIMELMEVPRQTLHDGSVYKVNNLGGEYIIIDGYVYPLQVDGQGIKYFSVYVDNGSVTVGRAFFNNTVTVTDPYGCDNSKSAVTYDLQNKPAGYEIKIYYLPNNDPQVKAEDDVTGIYEYYLFFDGYVHMPETNTVAADTKYTEYFYLKFKENSDTFGDLGWMQLTNKDPMYHKINSIVDMYKGNNPHNGNLIYDNGYEYFTYFNQLFKAAIDNEDFDMRCIADDLQVFDDINEFGFRGLIDKDGCSGDYNEEDITDGNTDDPENNLMMKDSKIHYFGNYRTMDYGGKDIFKALDDKKTAAVCHQSAWRYANATARTQVYKDAEVKDYEYFAETEMEPQGTNIDAASSGPEKYDLRRVSAYTDIELVPTTLAQSNCVKGTYRPADGNCDGGGDALAKFGTDGMTLQIVNNRIWEIYFTIPATDDKQFHTEVKYYEDVILPYMEQMLPSNVIYHVHYAKKS